MTHLIDIEPDGTMITLGNPLKLKGTITSQRWSTIKPVSPLPRLLFNTVRYWFGDKGRMAAFTRRWPCTWHLTILHNGWTARCDDRAVLVDIEHEKYFVSEGIDL